MCPCVIHRTHISRAEAANTSFMHPEFSWRADKTGNRVRLTSHPHEPTNRGKNNQGRGRRHTIRSLGKEDKSRNTPAKRIKGYGPAEQIEKDGFPAAHTSEGGCWSSQKTRISLKKMK